MGRQQFDASDLAEMVDAAGEGRIAAIRSLYHLNERAIEHSVIPWCEAHGVAVWAYSPFGHNDFPAPKICGRQDFAGDRVASWRDTSPGGARLSRALAVGVRDPKSVIVGHAAENAGAGDVT